MERIYWKNILQAIHFFLGLVLTWQEWVWRPLPSTKMYLRKICFCYWCNAAFHSHCIICFIAKLLHLKRKLLLIIWNIAVVTWDCVQCICVSRSPGLWWPQWACPVYTALCRSEAAWTPRSRYCTSPGSLWCGPGPAEGCRAFLSPSRGSHLDSMVLQKRQKKIHINTDAITLLIFLPVIHVDASYA